MSEYDVIYTKVLHHYGLHCEDGPAVVLRNGDQEWWFEGKLHREDGPAIILNNGGQEWYKHGNRHREDGPAYDCQDGIAYYINDKLHRLDGPASIFPCGLKQYYINGNYYTEKDYYKVLFMIRKYLYRIKNSLRRKVVNQIYNLDLKGLCKDVCNIIGEYVY